MDGSTIGIFAFLVINLLVSAFSAGKLHQRFGYLCDEVNELRKKLENTDSHLDNLAERVAKLEGKLEK